MAGPLLTRSPCVPPGRTISTTTPLTIDGGASADLSANRTIALPNTTVTPASYTYGSFTVDSQGRLTAASSGAAPVPTSRQVIAGTGLTGGGALTADVTLTLGSVPAGSMPALTGDVTSSAGSVATTIAAHAVTYAKEAQAAANTLVGNNTGGTADKTDLTTAQVVAMLSSLLAPRVGDYGDGSDGAIVLDGTTTFTSWATLTGGNTYTMTREVFASSLTINTGISLLPVGFAVFCKGTITLTGTGKIQSNGPNSTGATGGGAPWLGIHTLPNGVVGGAESSAGAASATAPTDFTNTGGTGGTGGGSPGAGVGGGVGRGGGGGGSTFGAGAAAGAVTTASSGTGHFRQPWQAYTARLANGTSVFSVGSGGGGGATGSGTATGGFGGSSAGWLVVHAAAFSGSGTVEAKGGNGGAGATPASTGNGSAGGGGGAGGIIVIECGSGSLPTTIVTGGTGGAGGAGNAGTGGAAGGNGGAGIVIALN